MPETRVIRLYRPSWVWHRLAYTPEGEAVVCEPAADLAFVRACACGLTLPLLRRLPAWAHAAHLN
jgi:hypothetical protein